MTFTKESARETITTIREMVGKGVNISRPPVENAVDSSGPGSYRSRGTKKLNQNDIGRTK